MIVEVHGAVLKNKGAELMLRTLVDALSARIPSFQPAVDPDYGSFLERARLGLWQVVPKRTHVGTPGFAGRFRRQRLFADLKGARLFKWLTSGSLVQYGCVTLKQIDALVDISGFAYTDQWGPAPAQDFALLSAYYRTKGKPVVLMPQAFGPFATPETCAAIKAIVANANLIFARDRQSLAYLTAVVGASDKIFLAPDITLFYPRESGPAVSHTAPYICIVPNVRMLDQGKDAWGDRYRDVLSAIAEKCLRNGYKVKILVHDTSGQDLVIAQQVVERAQVAAGANGAIALVIESDPVALKTVIAGAHLTVGSRFHSLVAALASGVPAFAIGWSHKYEMLFDDFHCPECVLQPTATTPEILARIAAMLEQPDNDRYREIIRSAKTGLFAQNTQMWENVAAVLTRSLLPRA